MTFNSVLIVACLLPKIMWIIIDAYTIENDIDFWDQPGLYIYTMIGNLLLYRLTWAFNIYIWSKFDVNYISILRLSNNKPNLILVVDQTATLLLVYFINLLIFLRANSSNAIYPNSFLSYGTPFLLLIASIAYQIYEYFFMFGGKRVSRGIFSRAVLQRCISAPFVAVTFRDVYAADVLTSFTRIITDLLYSSCWVLSGSFLKAHDSKENVVISSYSDFGSSYMSCTNTDMITTVSLVQMLPLVIRTFQCLRSMKDQKYSVFPQGYNSLKYFLSIMVVVVALQDSTNIPLYLFFIALSTFYKWWWDVVMDWGLFDRLPQTLEEWFQIHLYAERKMFLRDSLMYPYRSIYYICILVDLVLRFLWVISTLPTESLHGLIGYQLSFFLGAMEILRRCMWGVFRVEFEHIKMMKNKSPGFLTNRVMRDDARDGDDSDDDLHSSWKSWKAKIDRNGDNKENSAKHHSPQEMVVQERSTSLNPLNKSLY
jgi:hypothetical protein